ncbi:methylmalonyl-CoA mutase family protein [Ekhidna sp. To15]|uniref:methylmalonyl-CoA mutase family protein n=1 Tax=Ekhidna sp. To15 TaxID=3395267 RepID=UPI003F526D1A
MKKLDLNIFPQIDKDQWLQLAELQLKGADPSKELAWTNDANISLEGYYDQSDIHDFKYLLDFFSAIDSHHWKLYETIDCTQPTQANKAAIEALEGGCDGVILNNPSLEDYQELLAEINVEICDISVIGSGNLKPNPKFTGFHLCPNGSCISSQEKNNPVNQLGELLSSEKSGKSIYRIAHSDFFLEIAAVRALRFLLDQKGLVDIHIHSHIPLHTSEEHQWFLNTTSGLASILGGSHSIDLSTANGDSRISRNTGNLIREESGIEKYTDQCGGSYYIEALTNKIIKQVTEKLK